MEGYAGECVPQTAQRAIGEISMTQILKDKRSRLEQQLEDIKRAQQILEENPTLAELHNLLIRIR